MDDLVFAQDTFFERAQSLNRALRADVARIRFELHADAAERFKRVAQEQIFAFRVDGCAPDLRREPRPADFQSAICAVDIHITCHAYGAMVRALNDGKPNFLSRRGALHTLLDRIAHLFPRFRRRGDHQFPDFGVLRCLKQIVRVLLRERLKSDVSSFEGDGGDIHLAQPVLQDDMFAVTFVQNYKVAQFKFILVTAEQKDLFIATLDNLYLHAFFFKFSL